MSSSASAPLEKFLADWSLTFLLGGGVCLLVGLVVGWIIWRNARKLTEDIETGNRDALADFERASDEVSRVKAQLSGDDV